MLILVLSLIFICRAAEEDVLDLSDLDFSADIGQYDIALVLFYAPWCIYCRRLLPEYAEAAGLLKFDNPPITLVKVDCTEGGEKTCEKYSVYGYPTLKIFRRGEVAQEYDGPREAEIIVEYMRSLVDGSKELLTVADYEAFLMQADVDVVVIGFFEKETALKQEFLKMADKLRSQMVFGHSSAKAVLDKAGHKNSVVLFKRKSMRNVFEETVIKSD